MRQGFPLLNNKIVTQGNFDTNTKIFYCILLNNFYCIDDIITESRITTISSDMRICNFIEKETLAQVFSREFCEIFQNTFFTEHLLTTASGSEALETQNFL